MEIMKTHGVVATIAAVALMAAVATGRPAKLEPGTKVPDFALKDVNGKEHTLQEYLGGKYAVIMFIATQCPVSNAYNARMVKLADDYAQKGISFVAINSNKQESIDEIREHSKAHGFPFLVLKDNENRIADEYGAQVTPEIFLIDKAGVLRYHGRIDDSRDAQDVSSQDLRLSLDALLAGKDVPRAATKAFGCSIKRIGT